MRTLSSFDRLNNCDLHLKHLKPHLESSTPKVKLCTAKFSNAYKVAAHAQSFLRYAWTRGAMRMALNLWREEVGQSRRNLPSYPYNLILRPSIQKPHFGNTDWFYYQVLGNTVLLLVDTGKGSVLKYRPLLFGKTLSLTRCASLDIQVLFMIDCEASIRYYQLHTKVHHFRAWRAHFDLLIKEQRAEAQVRQRTGLGSEYGSAGVRECGSMGV